VEAGDNDMGADALNFNNFDLVTFRVMGSGVERADDCGEADGSSAEREPMSSSSGSSTSIASGIKVSESSSSSTTFRLLFGPTY